LDGDAAGAGELPAASVAPSVAGRVPGVAGPPASSAATASPESLGDSTRACSPDRSEDNDAVTSKLVPVKLRFPSGLVAMSAASAITLLLLRLRPKMLATAANADGRRSRSGSASVRRQCSGRKDWQRGWHTVPQSTACRKGRSA